MVETSSSCFYVALEETDACVEGAFVPCWTTSILVPRQRTVVIARLLVVVFRCEMPSMLMALYADGRG